MKKQLWILLLALVMVASVVACAACQPTTYALTYAAGEGSGTAPEAEQVAEGTEVTLKANMFTAPEGKEFDGWLVEGAKKAAGDKITMPAHDVTVTAQWKAKAEPNPQPEKVKVTFMNGTTKVAEVEVEKGGKLTASQIPAAPTAPEGKKFGGWFIAEAELTVNTVINNAVTANAKFVDIPEWTLTFKVGTETIKTIKVKDGGVVEELPECPEDKIPEGNLFLGWFDAQDKELVSGSEVTANATYTAKFELNSWKVTFKNGNDETVVWIAKDGEGKLAAAEIPAKPELAPDGKTFLGWYNGTDKAVANVEISSDIIFTATFVGVNDYVGAWYNDEEKISGVYKEDGTLSINVNSDVKNGTYDSSTGELKASVGTLLSMRTYTLLVINGQLKVVYSYYDGEDLVSETYILTKSTGATVSLISKENSENLDTVDGLILGYNATGSYYGRIVEKDGELSLFVYQNRNSEIVEKTITVDGNGAWTINGKMYFAVSTENRVSYDRDPAEGAREYLVLYTINQTTYAVYRKANVDAYVTIEGTVADGEVITIVFADESELKVKVSNGKLLDKGTEEGTYTCTGKSDIYLDGFGTATIGQEKLSYTIVENDVTIGEKVYTIDVENKTYTEKEPIGYEGTYIFINENETPKRYFVIVLDGYGIAQAGNKGGSRPTDLASGTYTVNGNVITLAGFVGGFNGNYEAVEDGKALIYHGTATGTLRNQALVKEGETITSRFDEFVGTWADSDKANTLVVTENKAVKFNGTAVTYTANYNGSVLTFEAACGADANGKTTYTATLSADGETVVITAKAFIRYDANEEENIYEDITITLTPAEDEQPTGPAHSCVGTWTGKPRGSSKVSTLVIKADGTYDLDGSTGAWKAKNENEVTFGMYTVNSATKSVSIYDDDAMGDYPWSDVEFTPAQSSSEPELDALQANGPVK